MSWLWWLQLAADLVLLGAVALLLIKLRGPADPSRAATASELDSFISEAGRLTQEFDRLLAEKRELVNTTLNTLDQRIAQLQKMVQDLENKQSPAAPKAGPETTPKADADPAVASFRRQVLKLAAQGQGAEQIAKATGRPRGEVELVLGLSGKAR